MEETISCERAWELNRDRLVKMAYINTFNALAITAELFWNLATEKAKKNV